MLVGEIGIARREYLYELSYCEILLITRGYFRRHHPGWEQARLVAHQVHYCMGVSKGDVAKTPQELIPFHWEQKPVVQVSQDEIEELQAEIAAINSQKKE